MSDFSNINLSNIKEINAHNDSIYSLSIFPSGNFISTSRDKSIKIWDQNYNNIQTIINAHDDYINYVEIKDEKSFITCSDDKSIKIWKKIEDKFELKQTIKNCHKDSIFKLIYFSNNKIISCSNDKTIKIWEEKENTIYQNMITLTHNNFINSILLIEDKNILISSGRYETKFWNINNFECIIEIEEIKCYIGNTISRLDKDKVIFGGGIIHIMKVISLSSKKLIKEIDNIFCCYCIITLEKKGIFLTGGKSENIRIYRIDNYECINNLNNVHNGCIYGICKYFDNMVISFSQDKKIKIWGFK